MASAVPTTATAAALASAPASPFLASQPLAWLQARSPGFAPLGPLPQAPSVGLAPPPSAAGPGMEGDLPPPVPFGGPSSSTSVAALLLYGGLAPVPYGAYPMSIYGAHPRPRTAHRRRPTVPYRRHRLPGW
jgi:hypothetical protein